MDQQKALEEMPKMFETLKKIEDYAKDYTKE